MELIFFEPIEKMEVIAVLWVYVLALALTLHRILFLRNKLKTPDFVYIRSFDYTESEIGCAKRRWKKLLALFYVFLVFIVGAIAFTIYYNLNKKFGGV